MQTNRQYYLAISCIALIHLLMLGYDFFHPEVFLHADRAGQRIEIFQQLTNIQDSKGYLEILLTSGNPGDYWPQWVVYDSLGRIGLIFIQVILTLISGHAVYQLAQQLKLNEKLAILACIFYLISPHALVFPHQLASEAIHTPILLISTWLSAAAFSSNRTNTASYSGLLMGLGNLVRPVTLLWPLLVTLFFILFKRNKLAAIYSMAAYLPIVLWMGFMAVNTGVFGMGESSRDLSHNLYQRVRDISQAMPTTAAQAVEKRYLTQGPWGKMPVSEYLNFTLNFPLPFIRHTLSDTAMFFSKSGIERLTIDYLPTDKDIRSKIQGDHSQNAGWRSKLEKEGVFAALIFLWQTQGIVLVISIVGALLMVLFSLCAIYGGKALLTRFYRDDIHNRFIALSLTALPIYVFTLSQAVDSMQSRHRAPVEAIMLLLVIYGINHFVQEKPSNGQFKKFR